MTNEEKKLIKQAIVLNAQYYGLELRPQIVAIFAQELEDLPAQAILDAYKAYRRDPANRTNPLPAKIREMIKPQASEKQIAQEIAMRCFGAIRKYGWTKPQQAREYIGELGWRLIERRGGWQAHCESTMEREIPTLTAQFREALTTYVEQGNSSDFDFFGESVLNYSQEPREQLSLYRSDQDFEKRRHEVMQGFKEEMRKIKLAKEKP